MFSIPFSLGPEKGGCIMYPTFPILDWTGLSLSWWIQPETRFGVSYWFIFVLYIDDIPNWLICSLFPCLPGTLCLVILNMGKYIWINDYISLVYNLGAYDLIGMWYLYTWFAWKISCICLTSYAKHIQKTSCYDRHWWINFAFLHIRATWHLLAKIG